MKGRGVIEKGNVSLCCLVLCSWVARISLWSCSYGNTCTAYLDVRGVGQEGNEERQRHRDRETKGKTVNEGHGGFPLCRIRKDMSSR